MASCTVVVEGRAAVGEHDGLDVPQMRVAQRADATPPLVTMPPTIMRVDTERPHHVFEPRLVEGGIGDLLDRVIRRRKVIDEPVAPCARREIAFAEERPQLLQMRRDERFAPGPGTSVNCAEM